VKLRATSETSTICAALRIENGRHTCEIYEHRPGICRRFICAVLKDARAHVGKNGGSGPENMFHGVSDEEFQNKALEATRLVRSYFRWDYEETWDMALPDDKLEKEAVMFKKGTLPFFQQLVQIQIPSFPPQR
jgi:hypothetical protein